MTTTEEESAIYEALGRAIAEWQNLEFILAFLLATMLRPDNLTIGVHVFYAPTNFKDKLAVVNATAQLILPPTLKADWDRLSKKLGELAGRRNKLAHASVGMNNLLEQPTASPIRPGSPKWDPHSEMTLKHIIDLRRAFSLASRRVSDLQSALIYKPDA